MTGNPPRTACHWQAHQSWMTGDILLEGKVPYESYAYTSRRSILNNIMFEYLYLYNMCFAYDCVRVGYNFLNFIARYNRFFFSQEIIFFH